ncbi:hypothetical protein [Fimbriiglobus ruber]|uniref:hypothetical protein n=1 Tax=Fimbriiglobus ruber TaxID=1908690 RepID=UPI000B4B72DA|nr:hypothetical protein [Fimbriiglobus ruber]
MQNLLRRRDVVSTQPLGLKKPRLASLVFEVLEARSLPSVATPAFTLTPASTNQINVSWATEAGAGIAIPGANVAATKDGTALPTSSGPGTSGSTGTVTAADHFSSDSFGGRTSQIILFAVPLRACLGSTILMQLYI